MTDDRRERRFTMDLRTGRIVDPEAPETAGADDEDDWRPIGELDPSGRSTVDLSKARRWRPLAELRRW